MLEGGVTSPVTGVPSDAAGKPASPAPKLRVFVSYSRADIKFADELVGGLELSGFAPSIDRHSIVEGEDWRKRLGALIADSDTVVFVVSPDSAKSDVCRWEIDEAVRLSKRILPVLWRPTGAIPVPEKLAALNYVRFDEDRSFIAGIRALGHALNTDLDWLREHTRLLTRAIEWENGGRPANRLLSGDDIAKAKAWIAAKPRTAPEPTALHLDFVKASESWEREQQSEARRQLAEMRAAQEAREQALAEREAAQQREAEAQAAREAAQREAAELAQREAAQARKTARRTLIGLIAALVLSLAAGAATYIAYEQRQEAEKQRGEAFAQQKEAEKQKQQAELQSLAARRAAVEATAARNEAEATRSRLIASLASDATVRGDAATGIALTLELLPDQESNDPRVLSRPWSVPAERALGDALLKQSELLRMEGHTASVRAVAVTPAGSRIVTGADDNTVRIWDSATGAAIGELKGHTNGVYGVTVTPDGTRIVSVSWDDTLRIWDAETGAEIAVLKGHTNDINAVAISVDGTRIATGADDSTLRIWDAATGKELRKLEGHQGQVYTVAFSPDGTQVVSGAQDNIVRIWNVVTGAEIRKLEGHTTSVRGLAMTPDGARVVSGADDRTIRIWSAATGVEQRKIEGHAGNVLGVAVTPDGRQIVSASADRTVRIWDIDSGAEIRKIEGHGGAVTSVALSADGSRIVTGSEDRTVRVWARRVGPEIAKLEGHTDGVFAVTASPDGRHAVSASYDKTLIVWDLAKTVPVRTLQGHTGQVLAVIVSPDGKNIISGSEDKTIRVWDLATGQLLRTLTGHEGQLFDLALTLDGSRIVSASEDRTIRIWNASEGTEPLVLKGHTEGVISVALMPEGNRIVSGSFDRSLRIWNAETGAELRKLEGHTSEVYIVSVSPDGKKIVSAGRDKTIRIWNAETGSELRKIEGHLGEIAGLAMSADGRRIISGSFDKTVRVWDVETGEELVKMDGHAGDILRIALVPDGTKVLSASTDKTLRLWRLPPTREELVKASKQATWRCLTPGERRRNSLDPKPPAWCVLQGKWPYTSASAARLGEQLVGEDKLEEISTLRQALFENRAPAVSDFDRRIAQAHVSRGIASLENGRDRDAESQFALALQSDAGVAKAVAQAYAARSKKLLDEGKVKEADALFSQAQKQHASISREFNAARASSYVEHGQRLLGDGKTDQAEVQFALAIKQDAATAKEIARAYVGRGDLLLGEGKAEEAEALFARALHYDNSSGKEIASLRPKAHLRHGQRLLGEGKTDEAEVQFALAIKQDVAAAKDVARVYESRGDSLLDDARSDAANAGPLRDQALAMFERAVAWARRDGSDQATLADALHNRGRAQDARQQYTEAIADFREAQRLGQRNAGNWLWWATGRLSTQRRDAGMLVEAVLIATTNFLDFSAEVRKTINRNSLRSELTAISYQLGTLHVSLTAMLRAPDAAHDCDRLASHPYDPLRVADGMTFASIKAEEAIAACTSAIETDEKQGRFYLQRARASTLDGDRAREKKDEALARKHYGASLSDLEKSVALGYPMAFNNLAIAYQQGREVEKDEAKAADLFLQHFNRVLACCTALAARHLIEVEAQHDIATVRRVVGALLSWSAALGSEDSKALHAELITAGKLPAAEPLPPATFTDLPPWLRD